MASLRPVNVPIQPLMRNVTLVVNVTGVRTWKVRMWCAMRLFKLAVRIAGCNLRIETGEQ